MSDRLLAAIFGGTSIEDADRILAGLHGEVTAVRVTQTSNQPSILRGQRVRSITDYLGPDDTDRAYSASCAALGALSRENGAFLRVPNTDLSVWWLVELALFDPLWLGIRLAHAFRKVISSEQPDQVLIVGTDPRLPWKGRLLAAVAHRVGVSVRQVPARAVAASAAVPFLARRLAPAARGNALAYWQPPRRPDQYGAEGVSSSELLGPAELRLITTESHRYFHLPSTGTVVRARASRASGGPDDVGLVLRNENRSARLTLGPGQISLNGAKAMLDTSVQHEFVLRLQGQNVVVAVDGLDLIDATAVVDSGPDGVTWGHLERSGADTESVWNLVEVHDHDPRVHTRPPRPGALVVALDMSEFRWMELLGEAHAVQQYVENVLEELPSVADGRDLVVLAHGALGPIHEVDSLSRYRVVSIHSLPNDDDLAMGRDLEARTQASLAAIDLGDDSDVLLGITPLAEIIAANAGVRVAEALATRRYLEALRPAAILSPGFDGLLRHVVWAASSAGVPSLGLTIGFTRQAHRFQGCDGTELGCPRADQIAVWGDVQRRELALVQPLIGDSLVVTGRPRSDSFQTVSAAGRQMVAAALSVPADNLGQLIVLADTVRSTNGSTITPPEEFAELIDALAFAARQIDGGKLVVKPWLGDDIGLIAELCARAGNVAFLDPRLPIHNREILGCASAVIAQPSSILAEAAATGCLPILMETPATLYYYGSHAHEVLKPFCAVAVSAAAAAHLVVTHLKARNRHLAAHDLEQVFGLQDGHSAQRVCRELMGLCL